MEPITHGHPTAYTTPNHRESPAAQPLSHLPAVCKQPKNSLGVQGQFSRKAYELGDSNAQREGPQWAVEQGDARAQCKYERRLLNEKGDGDDSKSQATKAKGPDFNEEITPSDKGYQYLVYAVTWQPSFCKLKPETAGCDKPPQKFLTHGVWPYNDSTDQKTNRHPAFCHSLSDFAPANEYKLNSDILEKIIENPEIAELVTPDPRNMFKHEWEKHGTCSGKSIIDYFNDFKKLRAVVGYDQSRFSAWIGRSVIFNDLKSAFPDNTSFRCFVEKDKQYLHEVFYMINPDGTPYLKDKHLQIGIPCNPQETFIPAGVETNAK